MAPMCLAIALLFSVATLPMGKAHSTDWVNDRGNCRAPSLDDVIMGNPVEADSANEILITSPAGYSSGHEYVLTFASTRPKKQEYVVHISAGTLSNASARSHLECTGALVAWRRTEVATVMWTAPEELPSTPVVLTVAMAGSFGPVTLSSIVLQPAAELGSNATAVTSLGQPVLAPQFVLP